MDDIARYVNMRVLGVIPAEGSKRFPGKNIALLHGVPLIGYTIRAAKDAKSLTDFVVSTDDTFIAQLAASYGVRKIHLRDEMDDYHTSGKACLDALDWAERNAEPYDYLVLLHPTSPLRKPRQIDEAVERLVASGRDFLGSVIELPQKTHENVFACGKFAYKGGLMLNAAIYVMKTEALRREGVHVTRDCEKYLMDRYTSIDIDEPIDLKIAELYMNARLSQDKDGPHSHSENSRNVA